MLRVIKEKHLLNSGVVVAQKAQKAQKAQSTQAGIPPLLITFSLDSPSRVPLRAANLLNY